MTPLFELLARQIRSQGPISVAEYMALVLTHPQHGYYSRRDPFGAAGDFVTAPEIGQVFGELLGIWCVDTWQAQGAAHPVRLVELGPGRGTLMADLLRAARIAPPFESALSIHLVEVSPVLRRQQAKVLSGRPVRWHADLSDVPAGPTLLIANEFFDALPIRQYQRTPDGWAERLIDLSEDGQRLTFRLGGTLPTSFGERLPAAHPGAVLEISPAASAIAGAIGQRVARYGGGALIIDYGYARTRPGDSLQALRRHRPQNVLEDPGNADLTAHVDFQALAEAAEAAGAVVHGPIAQGPFLCNLGIMERTERLLQKATPAQARELTSAAHRLTAPEAMGELFKVLAIMPGDAPLPAGFPAPRPGVA